MTSFVQAPYLPNRISDLLPHRYPFLLVDRVILLDAGQRAHGYKNVTLNEEFFQGYYPGNPIMPGVLIVEAMGHALGAVSHLPHGLCMNLFLPYILEYNLECNADRVGELLLPLNGSDVYYATPAAQRPQRVIDRIYMLRNELYERCQLPRTLKHWRIQVALRVNP